MHRYSYYQPVAYVTNIDSLSQADDRVCGKCSKSIPQKIYR